VTLGEVHLSEVWRVTQNPTLEFAEKLDRLFELEEAHLELPYGFLTQIDREADIQTIEAARANHPGFSPGETAPLSETYCRKTIADPDGQFALPDAEAAGWGRDPAYERWELEAYLGTAVELEGGLYGTLCFAGPDPRDESFSDSELQLMQLLGQWASNELQIRNEHRRLEEEADAVEELAQSVSHDLRTPLNVAQGQVQLLQETIDEAVADIDAAHRRMGSIIEQAHALARVDEPVTDPDEVLLGTCIRETWDLVAGEAGTLKLGLEGMRVRADAARLRSLLENLLQNAIEHGGGAVTVEVGSTNSGFYIADDGPGIDPASREQVFTPGYSTKSGGTGFGLSIVARIADAHGWDIHVSESAAGGTRFDVEGVEWVSA
jgi:signal transduction histidine kinase